MVRGIVAARMPVVRALSQVEVPSGTLVEPSTLVKRSGTSKRVCEVRGLEGVCDVRTGERLKKKCEWVRLTRSPMSGTRSDIFTDKIIERLKIYCRFSTSRFLFPGALVTAQPRRSLELDACPATLFRDA
jgi:hypothetical protein